MCIDAFIEFLKIQSLLAFLHGGNDNMNVMLPLAVSFSFLFFPVFAGARESPCTISGCGKNSW